MGAAGGGAGKYEDYADGRGSSRRMEFTGGKQ
jgi:hypothetical protein